MLGFDGRPVQRSRIQALTDALGHRGRDSANVLHCESQVAGTMYAGLALGHRRLSIIDLSDGAAQPMWSDVSGHVMVYNGELYNYLELRNELIAVGHRFRTDSDTEVVLAAYCQWGEACVRRFNGMFALAIWDEAKQQLFCARDPLGIKPFYYVETSEEFAFASESQALMKLYPGGLSRDGVVCYLLSMYVPRELSIYERVRKLLPGHVTRVETDGTRHTYSYVDAPVPEVEMTFDEAADTLLATLDAAVYRQLRSDVPVGLLLSGGFDSGMLLASASRMGVRLHTYSVGYAAGSQESELETAAEVAAMHRALHRQRVIEDDEVLPLLNRALACLTEPVADTAMVPTYCLAGMAAEDGVKVLLSGTGGDEVFAGYSRYVSSSFPRRILFALPYVMRDVLGRTLFNGTYSGLRLCNPSLDMMTYAGGSRELARYLLPKKSDWLSFLDHLSGAVFPAPDISRGILHANIAFDTQVYLPDLLLLLLDQLTMVHTIEGRVPLLDLELLAAAQRVPLFHHADPSKPHTRLLMRRMAEGRVSPRTFSAKKMGFSGPVVSWITSNELEIREVVMTLRNQSILAELPIEALWETGVRTPSRGWAMQMFSLYCMAGWLASHAPS
jgi:asparagine synthase (glutamine-hydrolysing)